MRDKTALIYALTAIPILAKAPAAPVGLGGEIVIRAIDFEEPTYTDCRVSPHDSSGDAWRRRGKRKGRHAR